MKNLIILLAFSSTLAWGQDKYEVPAERKLEDLISRDVYTFSYNESYELSSFVAYTLTKERAEGVTELKGKIKKDPDILTNTGEEKDLKKTGYVPGLIIPAEHFASNETVIKQLHYMTNIAPMKPAFYTQNWKAVEKLFRAWVIMDDAKLYIAAGPVLNDAPFPTLGDNKISIPNRYYKVVLDIENKRAIGFIFKNGFVQSSFSGFAMSIDEVEKETGMDFFPLLDDELENSIEATYNKDDWDWEAVEKVYGE